MKRIKYNRLVLSDDCWGLIGEYIDNIEDLNSFELTCRTFYFIVQRFYDTHFGKKLYTDVHEFIKSDSCVTNLNNYKPFKKYIWIHGLDIHHEYCKYRDELSLFQDEESVKNYYERREIYKSEDGYNFDQKENLWTGDECTEYYDEEESKSREICEKDFKRFVQRIKGYFFVSQ